MMARPRKAAITLPAGVTPWFGAKQGLVPYTVEPFEREDRGYRVYLRWRHRGNWRMKAARDEDGQPLLVRTVDGKLVRARTERALACAKAWYETLVTTAGAGPTKQAEPPPALSFAAGRELAFDPAVGKYPKRTPHRDEVARELERVIRVFGALRAPLEPITTWEAVRNRHLRALWRSRIRELHAGGHHGLRPAEITVGRLLAVARWLRDEEHLPAHACVAPKDWKAQLRADWIEITGAHEEPTPARPRYALDEMRRILKAAREADPRMRLLIGIGAEQRLGQVVRARRGNLDLARGLFRVPGIGKKKGGLIELTEGQMRILREALGRGGYLEPWEGAHADYPFFPGGALRAGQVHDALLTVGTYNRTAAYKRFLEIEATAQVPHQEGRAWYGLRRQGVDAADAEGISLGGLEQFGGWTNSKMPTEVYRERESSRHRSEARDVRAKVRGEDAEPRDTSVSRRAEKISEAHSGTDAPSDGEMSASDIEAKTDATGSHHVAENETSRPVEGGPETH